MEKLKEGIDSVIAWIDSLLLPILNRLDKIETRIDALEESEKRQDAKIRDLYEKLDTVPIDPPTDPPSIDWPGIINDFDVVVFHFDGNNNDDDDIAALPISALYAKASGRVGATKFFFNNSRDENDVDWQVAAMRNSAAFAESLGIECFDYAADEAGTLNELVSILSSGQKVLSLEGGPMGTIYLALEATPVEFHKNITLVSHSQWNENRDNSGENKKWNPMKEKFPQVTYIDIKDQNGGFKSDDWNALDLYEAGILKAARDAMKRAGEKDPTKVNDASDSGMFYWALTGNEDGTVTMALSLFDTYLENDFSYGDFYKAEAGVYISNPVPGSGWESESGYLVFKGDDSFENQKDETTILLAADLEPGKYQVQIWNKGGDPSDVSKENDSWIRGYPDFYAQKGNGEKVYETDKNDTSNGFIKFYSNTGDWTLQTSAIDNDPHQIFIEIETAGIYVFKLGGRSKNHSVGRIFLRNTETDPSILDKYTPDYVSGDPIDPPINPELGEVEIVSNRALIAGSEGFFEARVSGSLDIEAVEFFLNNERVNIERNYKYESKFTIPKGKFEVSVKVVFKNGAGTLTDSKVFSTEAGSGGGSGGSGGSGGEGVSPEITEFNDFVAANPNRYYTLDGDTETERVLSEVEVEALFNIGAVHMGKPDSRARIEAVPGLTNRKAFTFIMNNESGGFGDRLDTHKRQGIANPPLYPEAKGIARYMELYFNKDRHSMRTHYKSSSITSELTPTDGSNTFDGVTVREGEPGRAECVCIEHYAKASQLQSDPNRKGDVMKLYLGEHSTWTNEDYALIDTPEYMVFGMGVYCAHPMTYIHQNMIYPCKPGADGLPTANRLLMPTNKLIKSWIVVTPNTVVNGEGQYDGGMKWWLQIDGIHNGEPFLAAILENFMWTTGQEWIIRSVSNGAYFNTSDTPSNTNQYYVLKDIVNYKTV